MPGYIIVLAFYLFKYLKSTVNLMLRRALSTGFKFFDYRAHDNMPAPTAGRVSDDVGRIAMLEKRVDGEEETLVRYVYSNHLQSASLKLEGSANITR